MPFILKVIENNKLKSTYRKYSNSFNSTVLNLKRSIGLINLLPDNSTNTVIFYLNDRIINAPLELKESNWQSLNKNIESNTQINNDSRIYVNKDITISKGISVQIQAGLIIAISEGVNIINNGTLIVNGADENPVVFTCINHDKDIWNIVRQIWQPKIEKLFFINTAALKPVKEYSDLIIIN